MSLQEKRLYEFGPFRLDTAERLLSRDGRPVPVTPKAFETLLVLVRNSGHLMDKEELLKAVWPDTFVEEANLTQNIFTLRNVLGESKDEHQYIETVPKRGYRFVASVREVRGGSSELIVQERPRSPVAIEEKTDGEGEGKNEIKEAATRAREVQAARLTSSAESLVSRIKGDKRGAVLVIAALVIAVVVLAFGLPKFARRHRHEAESISSFQTMKVIKLTDSGKVRDAAISPDGKYVVHVMEDVGQQGLWTRQVATTSNVQIVPPAEVRYQGLTFSHDGNFIYYVRGDISSPLNTLYQVPVLGGASRRVIENVDSAITLSPDGKQLAFIRNYPGGETAFIETALIVASADGTREQKLVTRRRPDFFQLWPGRPAWSPDGKIIACAVGNYDSSGRYEKIVEFRVEDRAEKPITSQRWYNIGAVAWLSDGSGLLVSVRTDVSSPHQITYISYPSGEARRVTNDLNDYHRSLSVTADSGTLVTVQSGLISNIWIMPNGDTNRAKQITSSRLDGANGISWTPDGKIVYVSTVSGTPAIWAMESDGTAQKQLTTDDRWNAHPSVSNDGRYIVFASVGAGPMNIWRIDIDGGNPKQLTSGIDERMPLCSPDGKWVVYASFGSGPSLWKVPIDGGNPVRLTDKASYFPALAPDRELIAYYYTDEQPNPQRGIAVIPFEGGEPIKRFDIPTITHPGLRWTPDGRTLAYVITGNGISNIWSQPLDGSPPKQLTDFKSDLIYWFEWSRDGKQLALARGTNPSDVVLISNLR